VRTATSPAKALFAIGMFILGACEGPNMVVYTPTRVGTTVNPDTIYAAAVRVFVKKGWGFQSRDANARAVETEYIRIDDSTSMKGTLEESYRVFVNNGNIEVFTSCRWNDSNILYTKCEAERREGLDSVEKALVQEILHESKALAPPSQSEARTGTTNCVATCGNDRQTCFSSCGKSGKCKEGCVEGYTACVKACGQ
jgi:hypothetical protein